MKKFFVCLIVTTVFAAPCVLDASSVEPSALAGLAEAFAMGLPA